MLRLVLAAIVIALAPATHAADTKQSQTTKQITLQFEIVCAKLNEESKKTVLEFYDAAINQKNFEAAAKS